MNKISFNKIKIKGMSSKKKQQYSKTKILMKEFKFQCKEVNKAVAKDDKEYFEKGFDDGMDSAKAWRTANELLGTIKNLSPTATVHQADGEDSPELINNPLKMATIFINFVRLKITKLRQKTATEATIAPTTRLRNWLNKRPDSPPQFKIKKIGLAALRRAVKKKLRPYPDSKHVRVW